MGDRPDPHTPSHKDKQSERARERRNSVLYNINNDRSRPIPVSPADYDINTIGLLHSVSSSVSLSQVTPPSSSFIDHRAVNPPKRKRSMSIQLHHPQNSPTSPGHHKSSPPGNFTSPSFAERWMNRNSRKSVSGPNPILPLTNQNLRDLEHSPSDEARYGSVDEIDPLSEGVAFHNPFHNDSNSINSYEYNNSNPSSDHSGDSTSLDDVCFPMEFDGDSASKAWPDLNVLEEFVDEEMENLKLKQLAEDQSTKSKSPSILNEQVQFRMSNDGARTPLLNNAKVNEVESVKGNRLRPKHIDPWNDKTPKSKMDPILSFPVFDEFADKDTFRFTYFREDLDETIHSPTISGLLQPNQTFKDLFLGSHYMKSSESLALNLTQTNSLGVPSSGPGLSRLNQSNTIPSNRNSQTDTPTPSVTEFKDINPFWLDVLNPSEEEMKVLSKAFNIHPLTTEDIFLGETREKVELFKDYYFICFRSFDIVYEKRKQRKRELKKLQDMTQNFNSSNKAGFLSKILNRGSKKESNNDTNSVKSKYKKQRELEPLNMYIIVFRDAVITFHFSPTPHPMNVRRRARLLRDYLTVSSDWIGYALIDDITDAFAPMIDTIEDEVNILEDEILRMHSGDSDDSDDDSEEVILEKNNKHKQMRSRSRSKSTIDNRPLSIKSVSTKSSTTNSTFEWKRRGDMLRRVGECRKRVMSILRLLGSKADVIKGFAKRCNEQWEVAPRSEIGMYLGDIQDHIITMTQALNHYEKLLARVHSNYLAQINIDMTKVNNDMNDVLGKITVLGTIVLPINVVTGLWGMNVIVPGQTTPGLMWFFSIIGSMICFSITAYFYAKRVAGFE